MEVQKNDEQLPSQEEIREQFGNNPLKEPLKQKVKELTELCYDLLKIQIPFFSKKSKDASTHMKMIVDIYCQLPKEVKPMERTEMQKLYLKTKFRKPKVQKWVRSVEELKGIHNEYNNYYYWANDHLQACKLKKQQKEEKKQELDLTPENMEAWLEENVWRYYD